MRKLILHLAHTFCAVNENDVAMVGGINVVRSAAAAAGFRTIPPMSGCAPNGCAFALANGNAPGK